MLVGGVQQVPPSPVASPPPPPVYPPTLSSPAATCGEKKKVATIVDPNDALITAEPEMLSCRITPEDEFVLLACDGLFDVFSSEEVN